MFTGGCSLAFQCQFNIGAEGQRGAILGYVGLLSTAHVSSCLWHSGGQEVLVGTIQELKRWGLVMVSSLINYVFYRLGLCPLIIFRILHEPMVSRIVFSTAWLQHSCLTRIQGSGLFTWLFVSLPHEVGTLYE